MTTTKAILWDMDGVIVMSGEHHYEAYRELFEEIGVPFSREQYFDELFGVRNWDIIRTVAGDLPRDEIERLAERKEEKFRRIARGKIEALPGAKEMIERASESGVKQAIVSSTPCVNIELVLQELGMTEAFGTIVGEEDAEKGKPDPEGFLVAAERLGVEPAACVVIEDAPAGIEAGNAGGMRTIGVTTTRAPERLSEADLVVGSLEDERAWRFVSG
jgi:beta-phosphoglucomutase